MNNIKKISGSSTSERNGKCGKEHHMYILQDMDLGTGDDKCGGRYHSKANHHHYYRSYIHSNAEKQIQIYIIIYSSMGHLKIIQESKLK